MKYWDTVLFPRFLATISGQKYLTMTDQQLYEELNNLALRATHKFKFPHVSLKHSFTVATLCDDNEVVYSAKRYYFINDEVDEGEINVVLAWMKYYWYEMLISNSDNYQNLYFDSNIKTYSPGNLLNAFEKNKTTAFKEARETEMDYSRVNVDGDPSIGDVNV